MSGNKTSNAGWSLQIGLASLVVATLCAADADAIHPRRRVVYAVPQPVCAPGYAGYAGYAPADLNTAGFGFGGYSYGGYPYYGYWGYLPSAYVGVDPYGMSPGAGFRLGGNAAYTDPYQMPYYPRGPQPMPGYGAPEVPDAIEEIESVPANEATSNRPLATEQVPMLAAEPVQTVETDARAFDHLVQSIGVATAQCGVLTLSSPWTGIYGALCGARGAALAADPFNSSAPETQTAPDLSALEWERPGGPSLADPFAEPSNELISTPDDETPSPGLQPSF